MKVVLNNKNNDFAYYPNIMATCDFAHDDAYHCTQPILTVEILSPSTERTDLREKFDNYTSIPSLMEYIVVSQDVPLVRLFRRRTSWKKEAYYAEDTFRLESVELDVPVLHIYRRVRKEVGLEIHTG